MNYIVIEMQTTNGATAALLTSFDDYSQAEQHYHTVLAAAAVSSVTVHSAAMLNERGYQLKYECYDRTEPVLVEE